MRMADGARERIGGVGRGIARKREQAPHHVLHLLLLRMAAADHGLLHLQRGVFGHRKPGEHRGADGRAARLPQGERGLRIDVDEYLLHRDLERAVRGDDLVQALEDRLQAPREIALAGLDAAARDVVELVPGALDDAETGDLQPRIDPEDSQVITAVV